MDVNYYWTLISFFVGWILNQKSITFDRFVHTLFVSLFFDSSCLLIFRLFFAIVSKEAALSIVKSRQFIFRQDPKGQKEKKVKTVRWKKKFILHRVLPPSSSIASGNTHTHTLERKLQNPPRVCVFYNRTTWKCFTTNTTNNRRQFFLKKINSAAKKKLVFLDVSFRSRSKPKCRVFLFLLCVSGKGENFPDGRDWRACISCVCVAVDLLRLYKIVRFLFFPRSRLSISFQVVFFFDFR